MAAKKTHFYRIESVEEELSNYDELTSTRKAIHSFKNYSNVAIIALVVSLVLLFITSINLVISIFRNYHNIISIFCTRNAAPFVIFVFSIILVLLVLFVSVKNEMQFRFTNLGNILPVLKRSFNKSNFECCAMTLPTSQPLIYVFVDIIGTSKLRKIRNIKKESNRSKNEFLKRIYQRHYSQRSFEVMCALSSSHTGSENMQTLERFLFYMPGRTTGKGMLEFISNAYKVFWEKNGLKFRVSFTHEYLFAKNFLDNQKTRTTQKNINQDGMFVEIEFYKNKFSKETFEYYPLLNVGELELFERDRYYNPKGNFNVVRFPFSN